MGFCFRRFFLDEINGLTPSILTALGLCLTALGLHPDRVGACLS